MSSHPDCLERRCGQRFDVQVPVSVRLSGSQHEFSGLTQDLSARGTFFFTDYPLATGEPIEVTLVMPSAITLGDAMRVRCQGAVLRVIQPSVGTMLGVAVQFTGYEYLAEAVTASQPSDFERISSLHEQAEKDSGRPAPEIRRIAS